jgi:hypothetical protein
MDVTLERPADTNARVIICRRDGSETAARLRLLDYDSCEFESDGDFAVGEFISIQLYRMGSIRARVAYRAEGIVEAEFDKSCPV